MAPTANEQHPSEGNSQTHATAAVPAAPPKERATKSQLTERNARARVLVHWSKSEKRWKPVSPAELRAARTAAREVATYLLSPPRLDSRAQPESAPQSKPGVTSLPATRAAVESPAPKKAVTPPLPATRKATATALNASIAPHLPPTPPTTESGGHGVIKHRASTSTIDEVIREAAARHGVDPDLVRAVIKAESNFNSQAVSRKGAMGLMQLSPGTAKRLKVNDPFDPAENVDAGVRHLKALLTSYNGDIARSLAAYNAGPGAVARANGVPNYSETRHYVKEITRMFRGNPPLGTAASDPATGNKTPVEMSAARPNTGSNVPVEASALHPKVGPPKPAEISAPRPATRSSSPARSIASSTKADNTPIRTYRAPDGVLVISDR